MTRLDEQIAYERVVELRTNLLGHHFWKNHRNEVGLMSGLLAAVSVADRAWMSTTTTYLERCEDYALDRERFDASRPRPRPVVVGTIGATGSPVGLISQQLERAVLLHRVDDGAWRDYVAAVIAANVDHSTLSVIARAWCYRDDLIDDDLSLAFDAAMEIRQRWAAYGLFADPGYPPAIF